VRHVRPLSVAGLLAVAVCGLAGCSNASHDTAPIRVGDSTIATSTIAHWMTIMAPGHIVSRPPHYTACVAHEKLRKPSGGEAQLKQQCRSQYDTLRREVLEFLISEKWLTQEAAETGLRVTTPEVRRRLDQRRRSFSNDGEFQESLRAIDHSVTDVELEIRGELAAQKLRRRAVDRAPKVTQAQLASHYARHVEDFYVPQRRYFYIVENLKSAAAAKKLSAEFAQGKARIADNSLRESLAEGAQGSPEEHRIIYKAIFAAKPRVLTKPILINHLYFLVEVTRIAPARQRSLAEVRGEIQRKLTSERQRRALSQFVQAWRTRWRARTDCSPGYVVPRCRQDSGSRVGDEPLGLA
jgi:PPIC-type PPIASE domain/SurA-like N-terminal domain